MQFAVKMMPEEMTRTTSQGIWQRRTSWDVVTVAGAEATVSVDDEGVKLPVTAAGPRLAR